VSQLSQDAKHERWSTFPRNGGRNLTAQLAHDRRNMILYDSGIKDLSGESSLNRDNKLGCVWRRIDGHDVQTSENFVPALTAEDLAQRLRNLPAELTRFAIILRRSTWTGKFARIDAVFGINFTTNRKHFLLRWPLLDGHSESSLKSEVLINGFAGLPPFDRKQRLKFVDDLHEIFLRTHYAADVLVRRRSLVFYAWIVVVNDSFQAVEEILVRDRAKSVAS